MEADVPFEVDVLEGMDVLADVDELVVAALALFTIRRTTPPKAAAAPMPSPIFAFFESAIIYYNGQCF